MGVQEMLMEVWRRMGGSANEEPVAVEAAAAGERKTAALPAVLMPYNPMGRPGMRAMPKATPANLRRFAETPVVRRAINVVKDRVACMDWQIRVRRGYDASAVPDALERMNALRRCLEEPNEADSFRVLWEQVLEDLLVNGSGAVEMETTGDAQQPLRMWAVDAASIQVNAAWSGRSDSPRYAQQMQRVGEGSLVPLLDDELMYLRLNARTHSAFGLGRLEVAFETVNQFLSAHQYAGRLASNSVVQYALWLDEATPERHDRLIRWWQDEIEGTGRVPIVSSAVKPEVLRFAGGTDADLRLQWQEFLVRMVANAFDLPPMLLGMQQDVNRSTAEEMADDAFRSAVVPVAKLLEEHITRDLFAKRLGWREFEFRFNDLEARNELDELQMQIQLLNAGVLSVDEVRAMRGLQHNGPVVME